MFSKLKSLDSYNMNILITGGAGFIGGAVVQWLRDEMKMVSSAEEVEEFANRVFNRVCELDLDEDSDCSWTVKKAD